MIINWKLEILPKINIFYFWNFSEELARQLQAEENRAQESQRASGAAAAASGGAASANIPSTSRPQGSPGRQQAQGSPPANNNNKKVCKLFLKKTFCRNCFFKNLTPNFCASSTFSKTFFRKRKRRKDGTNTR